MNEAFTTTSIALILTSLSSPNSNKPECSSNFLVYELTRILPYSPQLSILFAITTSLPYISYLTISVPITPPIIFPLIQ